MTNVINIADFKKKIKEEPELPDVDFGERLQRIRTSLDKINRLMSDLKKMGAHRGDLG